MKWFRGMVSIPPSVRWTLFGLGLAWLILGWVGGVAFWISIVLTAGVWGVLVGRRYANVTIEPWSEERGIVIWGYRRGQAPKVRPRLVWDDSPSSEPASPPDVPSAEVTPTALRDRLQPFPSHSGWVVAAEEPATPEQGMETAPAPRGAERKICPDCAETVLSEARVCRYCGYRFEPAVDEPVSPETQA